MRKFVFCRGGLDRVVFGYDFGEGVGIVFFCGGGLKDRGGVFFK